MTTSSLLKELKLLCRDLHGLAVLFVMPIAFMLIMSLALGRDQDPHTDSRIALVGAADDSVNTALAAALEKEQIHVTRMPSEKLTDAQNGLHDKRFQLVLHNSNPRFRQNRRQQSLANLCTARYRAFMAGGG